MQLRARAVDLHLSSPFVMAGDASGRRPWALGNLLQRARRSTSLRRAARRIGIPAGRVVVLQVELRLGGQVGYGEAKPLGRHGESVESALSFLDAIAGQLATVPPEQIVADGLDGLPPGELAARAALDAAAHDLAGKRTALPVWRLLGLGRTCAPTSFTLSRADPDAMARDAERAARRFSILKLKLGGGDGRDLDRVRAVRSATAVPLCVDANEGWQLDEALELLPALAALGVDMVEQPLRARHPGGERLKAASTIPVFVDEDCRTEDDLAECARRAHGVNVKLSKCGGIRAALRCVAAARALGLRTMVGCMIESSLGIAAAAQIAGRFDRVDLDANLLLDDDPFTGLEIEGGAQLPSARAGLGVRPIGAP